MAILLKIEMATEPVYFQIMIVLVHLLKFSFFFFLTLVKSNND